MARRRFKVGQKAIYIHNGTLVMREVVANQDFPTNNAVALGKNKDTVIVVNERDLITVEQIQHFVKVNGMVVGMPTG